MGLLAKKTHYMKSTRLARYTPAARRIASALLKSLKTLLSPSLFNFGAIEWPSK